MPSSPPAKLDVALRLKQARQARFPSAAAAARALGVNPFTVRAHESGQNGIPNSMLHLYSVAYGVQAEWLLTGSASTGYPTIPLVGILEHGTFKASPFRDGLQPIPLSMFVPGHENKFLEAYLQVNITRWNVDYTFLEFVIVSTDAKFFGGLKAGEYVVRRATTLCDAELVETALWLLWEESDSPNSSKILFWGDSLSDATSKISVTPELTSGEGYTIIGRVVARFFLQGGDALDVFRWNREHAARGLEPGHTKGDRFADTLQEWLSPLLPERN